jgi:23S rRNA pseudouridine1911/1915/1917 synthase
MTHSPQIFRVLKADDGLRLDLFLTRHLGISRRAAQRLLEEQNVRVEGKRASKGLALKDGWSVEVAAFQPPGSEEILPYSGEELEVLAEGSGWIAVDKPANMPVHPLKEDESATALNFVASRFPKIYGVGEGGLRSGVVHRLDVDTSGVLLFATEERSWKHLRAAFSAHRTEKVYQALVEGRFERPTKARLELRVARHRPARVEVVREGGQQSGSRKCLTYLKPLETFSSATLVEARPVSGFLHQIRVSLAHLGHPLLGDETYGGSQTRFSRHLLHASMLHLDEILVESGLPADFQAALEELRGESPRA